MSESLTGAQSLVRSLESAGAEVVFGIPGGAILPAYDPLFDSKIRHILVRHEQGAGHAAEGYAQATGKVGVCMATSGPGRDQPGDADRRRLHGLGADRRDHRPGAERRASARTPSRRPTSAASRCRSPSTTSWCSDADDIPRTIAEAFHIASTGRPGPVLVDIPKDILQAADHVLLAADARPARLPADDPPARQAGPGGRPADRRGQAPGAVRRRRRPQGARRGRAAGPGRAHRHPGRHDADGARRVPGQPPAAPRDAGHARHGGRGDGAAEVATC